MAKISSKANCSKKMHCEILDQLIICEGVALIKHYKPIGNSNQKQHNIADNHLIRIYDATEMVL